MYPYVCPATGDGLDLKVLYGYMKHRLTAPEAAQQSALKTALRPYQVEIVSN